MRVKAIKGFSGFLKGKPFNMHAGETRDIEDSGTVQELISIGYLEEADAPAPQTEPENSEPAEEMPDVPDEVKLNEDKRGKSKRN